MWVIEPRRDRHGVVGMEDVRCRRIVNDDGVCDRATKLGQILHSTFEGDKHTCRMTMPENEPLHSSRGGCNNSRGTIGASQHGAHRACQEQGLRTEEKIHFGPCSPRREECHGITNLAQTSSEHNDFVDLAHLLEEIVHTRSLDDVHIVPVVLYLNGNNVVRLLYRLYAILACVNLRRGRETHLETTVH